MTILYKHFLPARIVFCAAFAIFFIALSLRPAYAADPIFTVENVEVDVTAENAIAAREQAFAQAQVKAFEELSARMLPAADLSTLRPPDPLLISSMIQDYEIVNEKLSAVRYIGTYTFRFKDQSVRKYFANTGKSFTDVSSKSLLILPFLQNNGQTNIWSFDNPWRQAWNRAGQLTGIVPLDVPLGDLSDVRDIRDNEALSYNPANLRNLLSRYDSAEAVIALAAPDDQLAAVSAENDIAQGSLTIEIYRTDREGPELVQQVVVAANGLQTVGQVYDAGVLRVHQALQADWKTKTAITTTQSNIIAVSIPIQSLQQWVGLQSDLRRVPGITDVVLRALTPRQAMVDMLYQGDIERLRATLGQAGMSLEQGVDASGDPINMLRTGMPRESAAPKLMQPVSSQATSTQGPAPQSASSQTPFEQRF